MWIPSKSFIFSTFSSFWTKTSTFFHAIGFSRIFCRSGGIVGSRNIPISRFLQVSMCLSSFWMNCDSFSLCLYILVILLCSFSLFLFHFFFFLFYFPVVVFYWRVSWFSSSNNLFWSGLVCDNRNSLGSDIVFWSGFSLHSTSTFFFSWSNSSSLAIVDIFFYIWFYFYSFYIFFIS